MKLLRYVLLIIVSSSLLVGCKPQPKEEPPIHEFKIVTVGTHIETRTNNFGGVIEQKKKLDFTFLDSQGKAITKISDLDRTPIQLSNEGYSKVVQQGSNITLYLTEEMMDKLY